MHSLSFLYFLLVLRTWLQEVHFSFMLSIFCGLRLNYSARMHSHKAFEHVQVACVLLPEVFAVDFFMSSACPMWHSKLANAVFNISADQGCAFDFCCMFGLTVAWYLRLQHAFGLGSGCWFWCKLSSKWVSQLNMSFAASQPLLWLKVLLTLLQIKQR